MPKTEKEWEAELKQLEVKHSADIDTREALLDQKNKEIEELHSKIEKLEKDNSQYIEKDFEEVKHSYKEIYDTLPEKVQKTKTKPDDLKIEEMHSTKNYIALFNEIKTVVDEQHACKPDSRSKPPTGDDKNDNKNQKSRAQKELDK